MAVSQGSPDTVFGPAPPVSGSPNGQNALTT